MTFSGDSVSIYLHIPFCSTKCTYCAFNTYINLDALIPAFIDALIKEIAWVGQGNIYNTVHTIYFGGGTPSLLTPGQFAQVLDAIYTYFNVDVDAEVSTEANPNDLSLSYLRGLKQAGINRLSIGMQTANSPELVLFDRRHDTVDVINSVKVARQAGFDNLSLDLIYGFPQQTMQSWERSLQVVADLQPEHLSLYALGLEAGTPLDNWVNQGKLDLPEDDLTADMYDYATHYLHQHGYEQYEISNWAKPGRACAHNLQYWRNQPYLGLGPGAHGYANQIRYSTILSPQQYIQRMQEVSTGLAFPHTPATRNATVVDYESEIAETLMMHLRLLQEGLPRQSFEQRFDVDVMTLYGDKLRRFEQNGLLQIDMDAIRITQQGRLISNVIFRELI